MKDTKKGAAIEAAPNVATEETKPAPLTLALSPNASAPTYTAAIELNGVVLAIDDYDENEYETATAQESEMVDERAAAATVYNAQIKADAPDAEKLRSLLADINALDAARLAFWKEIANRKLKGVRGTDGAFYPIAGTSPICTLPARVALLNALRQRATLGGSDVDFLGS